MPLRKKLNHCLAEKSQIMKIYKAFGLVKKLWEFFPNKRKKQLVVLLFLMILASFAEILSIGSVIPFLGALTNPEKVFYEPVLQPMISLLDLKQPDELVIPFTIIFCFLALFSGLLRFILIFLTNHISFGAGADLSNDIYKKTLYQPYKVHISRNTSEVISGVSKKTSTVIYSIIIPILNILSSSVLLVSVLFILIAINPLVASISLFSLGSLYILISIATKNIQVKNSYVIAKNTTVVIKLLQEGLGGIRDVLINSLQKLYSSNYRKIDFDLRRAQAKNLILAQSPRFIIETFGMVIIALIAFYFSDENISHGRCRIYWLSY